MAAHRKFLESNQFDVVAVPINTTGAAVSGDWIDLKEAAGIVLYIAQGAWAGGTPAVTLNQATSVSGGSSKALSFTEAWNKTGLSNTAWAAVTVTSDTFNLTATANKVTAIEIGVDQLDRDNAFTCVQLAIASPGANADLIAAVAILYGIRNQAYPTLIDAATV